MAGQQDAGADGIIGWSKMDETIRRAYNKKVINSQKPSMWEYNPKGGMPTELANLDPSTFLPSRPGQILCSLPKDILVRVCSMLSVRDFIHLSLTCRFLHWRMFTFCTCSVPHTVVEMRICDYQVGRANFKNKKFIYPRLKYTQNNYDNYGLVVRKQKKQSGQRCIYVFQPFCLRKPFFFETLELYLTLPFYYKDYYDRILPYIMDVRGLARHLDVIMVNIINGSVRRPINFPATNDFLATVNASFIDINRTNLNIAHDFHYELVNKDIYMNCPYARQMNRAYVLHFGSGNIDVPVFQNNIGIYMLPLDTTIIATLENFLAGSSLVYHLYLTIERRGDRLPLYDDYFNFHVWKKVIATENGGQIRIVIRKSGWTQVIIGKEEMFDEMNKKYASELFDDCDDCWKMETAVEPDEAEEERASGVWARLNHSSCSIQ